MASDPTLYDGRLAMLVDRGWPAGDAPRGRGILFLAAHMAQGADVNRMAAEGRGICTITINEGAAIRLGLLPQGAVPPERDTPYLVMSVEAVACTETGISAEERALTLRTAGNPQVIEAELATPGHIMVQVARNVLRDGGTLPEIANALLSARGIARFSGWTDILDDDGEIADAGFCIALAARMDIACYDAGETIAFARGALSAWDAAVRYSRERLD